MACFTCDDAVTDENLNKRGGHCRKKHTKGQTYAAYDDCESRAVPVRYHTPHQTCEMYIFFSLQIRIDICISNTNDVLFQLGLPFDQQKHQTGFG